jgi:predicted acyltransferase
LPAAGLHFGHVLTHFSDTTYRLTHWSVLATALFALGWIINPFWAMNKQLWSPAYLFFMAGSCGYLLIALYLVYDFEVAAPEPPRWQRVCRMLFMPGEAPVFLHASSLPFIPLSLLFLVVRLPPNRVRCLLQRGGSV